MKKIKELAITDKNGNVGYIDLSTIDSNTSDINSLKDRVSTLENGDFQYAEKDFSNPANFSDMVLGTYYLVSFNENNEYTPVESDDVHHFDILVRLSTTEPPKKIRTQYVQTNIKDVAYTNKDNVFTGDNHFSGNLKVDNLIISSVSKNLVETDLLENNSLSININQTDYSETNEDESKTEYTKNLASVNIEANSELKIAELSVENKNFKIGIKSSENGVQTFAPIPVLETSSDDEIATVSNIREVKKELQTDMNKLANSTEVEKELNLLKTETSTINSEISDIKSKVNALTNTGIELDNKISENSNKIIELQSEDANLNSKITETSNNITELQNRIVVDESSISTLQGNVSDLYGRVWDRVQVVENEDDAKWEGVTYFLVDEIPPQPENPDNPETPEN